MTDKVTLTISVTPEERQRIEQLAQERGYPAPDDYLLALVESDSDEPLNAEELEEKAKLLDDLKQSIHEAMTGQTIPISELWKMLDNDE